MTVGPASGVLKDKPQAEWTAREVALTVLIDRSTARLSSGQRTALNDVEDARTEDRGAAGKVYVFEHLSQGSPTAADRSQETFRHALAATAVRPGMDGTPYLYTLNLSCPEVRAGGPLRVPLCALLGVYDAPGSRRSVCSSPAAA